jgi:hypothetical protein
MLQKERLTTIHKRLVWLAAVLLAVLLLSAANAAGSPPLDSRPADPIARPAATQELYSAPPSEAPEPTAITLRPGSLRAGHRVAAGLVGLVLAALALAGLTAAVLARRDELSGM